VPLTAERFAPYGDIIAPEQAMKVRHINYGNTDRFHNLANLDLLKDGGKPLVSIFRSRPLPRPIPTSHAEAQQPAEQAPKKKKKKKAAPTGAAPTPPETPKAQAQLIPSIAAEWTPASSSATAISGADDSAGSTSRHRIGSVRRPRQTRRCSFGVHLHSDNAATG